MENPVKTIDSKSEKSDLKKDTPVYKTGKVASEPVFETKNGKELMSFKLDIKEKEGNTVRLVVAPKAEIKEKDYVTVGGYDKKGSAQINGEDYIRAFKVEKSLKVPGTIVSDLKEINTEQGKRISFQIEVSNGNGKGAEKTVVGQEDKVKDLKKGDNIQVVGFEKNKPYEYIALSKAEKITNKVAEEKSVSKEQKVGDAPKAESKDRVGDKEKGNKINSKAEGGKEEALRPSIVAKDQGVSKAKEQEKTAVKNDAPRAKRGVKL